MELQEVLFETSFAKWRRMLPILHLMRAPSIAARPTLLLIAFPVVLTFHLLGRLLFDVQTNLWQVEILSINSLLDFRWIPIGQDLLAYVWGGPSLIGKSNWSPTLWTGIGIQLGMIMVMSILGLMITRDTSRQFSMGQGECLHGLISFGFRNLGTLFIGLFFPIITLAVMLGVSWGILWLSQLPAVGIVVGWGLGWFAYVMAFLGVIMGLMLLAGYPLIVSAIAVEKTDGFDAWSRSFSYVRSQWIYLTISLLLGLVLGGVVYCLLGTLYVQTISWVSYVQWKMVASFSQPLQFWGLMFGLLIKSYVLCYMWTIISGLYLLARLSVDRTPISEWKA